MHRIGTVVDVRPQLPAPIALCLGELRYRRETRPVWHDEKTDTWHVYRYSDVLHVLTDTRAFGAPRFSGECLSAGSALSQSPAVVAQRQPVVRKLMREALTPRAVSKMQPYVERTALALLDPLLPAGKLEVMSQLAWPLASATLGEFVGVPVEDRERLDPGPAYFARLASAPAPAPAPAPAFDPIGGRADSSPESQANLISRLSSLEVEGVRLTGDEVAASCYFFMTVVRPALSDMLGNMLLLLSLQPDVLERLRREPAPLYSTVEEALRYLPSVWTAHRTVIAPVVLGGQTLPKGAPVCAWLVSANHDSGQFDHPERFDIDRIPNRHLSFGDAGTFACLGGGLTRLVARLTLAEMAQRIAAFELASGGAVEVAPPCEPDEPEDTEGPLGPGAQGPTPTWLPARCSLAKLALAFEARA
jgi:cytochrome P450 family 109